MVIILLRSTIPAVISTVPRKAKGRPLEQEPRPTNWRHHERSQALSFKLHPPFDAYFQISRPQARWQDKGWLAPGHPGSGHQPKHFKRLDRAVIAKATQITSKVFCTPPYYYVSSCYRPLRGSEPHHSELITPNDKVRCRD
jgi:hypothetical protein